MFPKKKLYFEKARPDGSNEGDYSFEVRSEFETIMIVVNVYEGTADNILPKIEKVFINNCYSTCVEHDWVPIAKDMMNEKLLDALVARFIDENEDFIKNLFKDWDSDANRAI